MGLDNLYMIWEDSDRKELLRMLSDGKDYHEIGNVLQRTRDSIEKECRRMRRVMKAKNNTQLIATSLRNKFIE